MEDDCANEVILNVDENGCDWDDSIILDVFNDAILSHRTKVYVPSLGFV